jgi:hypothetical protein
MRGIPTLFEFTLSVVLASLGLYLLYGGYSDKSGSGGGFVLALGAVFFMLGMLALVPSIRNYVWHRKMLRQSARNILSKPGDEEHRVSVNKSSSRSPLS